MTCTQTVHNVGSDRLTRRFEVSVRENRHLSRVRHRTQRYVQSRPDHSVVGALSKDARPASLSTLVQSFQAVPDPMQRYRQLLFMAKGLDQVQEEFLSDERYKVPGCVSQVWIVPELRHGLVYYKAESDSQLTKGLAALLIKGLSGNSPQDISNVTTDFIGDLGLKSALTPSRTNGLLNMFNLMQTQAREFL